MSTPSPNLPLAIIMATGEQTSKSITSSSVAAEEKSSSMSTREPSTEPSRSASGLEKSETGTRTAVSSSVASTASAQPTHSNAKSTTTDSQTPLQPTTTTLRSLIAATSWRTTGRSTAVTEDDTTFTLQHSLPYSSQVSTPQASSSPPSSTTQTALQTITVTAPLPTLSGVNATCCSTPTVPPQFLITSHLKHSKLPQNFVFIVIGGTIALIVLVILFWRVLTQWCKNRSIRIAHHRQHMKTKSQANTSIYQQLRSRSNDGLGVEMVKPGTRNSSYYGDSKSIRSFINAGGRRTSYQARPSLQPSEAFERSIYNNPVSFYSPTAQLASHVGHHTRDSSSGWQFH